MNILPHEIPSENFQLNQNSIFNSLLCQLKQNCDFRLNIVQTCLLVFEMLSSQRNQKAGIVTEGTGGAAGGARRGGGGGGGARRGGGGGGEGRGAPDYNSKNLFLHLPPNVAKKSKIKT